MYRLPLGFCFQLFSIEITIAAGKQTETGPILRRFKMEPYWNYWPSICQCTRPLLTPMKKRSKKARSLICKHELIQPKWMLLRQWVRKYWRDWRVGRSGDLKVCFVFGSVVVQLYIYVLVSFGFTAYLEGQFSCFGLFCSQYWNIRAVSLQKSKHKKTKFLHFSSENVMLTQNWTDRR